jgi:hypothetical protein
MGQHPLSILSRRLKIGSISCDVEFGDIDGLAVCMSQEVKHEVEKSREIVAFLDVLDVVVLDLERLRGLLALMIQNIQMVTYRMLEMVEHQHPAEQVAPQWQWYTSFESCFSQCRNGRCF